MLSSTGKIIGALTFMTLLSIIALPSSAPGRWADVELIFAFFAGGMISVYGVFVLADYGVYVGAVEQVGSSQLVTK